MARRPDLGRLEAFTEEDLKELRHNLAHLGPSAVRDVYERAYQECRPIYNKIPTPKQIQTLVQAWKMLWKWR